MISVIIPTYKNKELLLKNLKLNLPFLEGCEIVVANDDPTESLKNDLKQFPYITLIENSQNIGFGPNVNQGVKIANGEYVMLLNNDVLIKDKSYIKAIKLFDQNPNLFAVSFAQDEKDNLVIGKNEIYWQNGIFQHKRVTDNKFGPNGWAEGGSCLIDKNKFIILGGFDPVYAPFYWEDVDLSFQAHKKGWQVLFDPEIRVIHHHESTIGKYYNHGKIEPIAFRNQLLFTWKYINNIKMLFEHLINLPVVIIKGGLPFAKGLILAIAQRI